VFRVTDGLQPSFGRQRCFDTPLAESAIVGVAVGMALRGLRPVPEIQFDGFTYPAFDQMVSHLAKINYPEAAVLGVGSIKERPAVVDGVVAARPTTALTLVFDHRVCDGAEAAAFLGDLRDLVERPELALLNS
jgi:2-oxoacid dehydrogenases acyltransferase (catalytic domain)/Transketolase, pyrimidine binding domain